MKRLLEAVGLASLLLLGTVCLLQADDRPAEVCAPKDWPYYGGTPEGRQDSPAAGGYAKLLPGRRESA